MRDSDRILGILQAEVAPRWKGATRSRTSDHHRYNPATERPAKCSRTGTSGNPARRNPRRDSGIEVVLQASTGAPVIQKETDAAEAYRDVIARFLGEEKPAALRGHVKPGLLKRLFGGK